jgi:zinc protease
LYTVKVMVMAGSVDDPSGKEGLANLVGNALIEGGFGDPKNSVTKKRLDEITRPWGAAAVPTVRVDKQTTTFTMAVPKEAFPQFVRAVLAPMFSQPQFQASEWNRLRAQALTAIQSRLRLGQQEMLGLEALESYLFQGTPLSSPSLGTVRGLKAIQQKDLAAFYKVFYTMKDVVVATDADPASAALLATAFPKGAPAPKQMCGCDVYLPPAREVLIITQPTAVETGIHIGFPIDAKRTQADYWPLFLANLYLGAHADRFGRLDREFHASRAYNLGDYSYIEYLAARQEPELPPATTPRSEQYFSVWVRPVANQYAHFVLKAVTAELHHFILEGMTPEQVEEAKTKARALYSVYAESADRRLGYRLSDAFYGMLSHGYLAEMQKNIDAATTDQVNAAIRRHLQVGALRYVITTNEEFAPKLADDIANNTNFTAKDPADYRTVQATTTEKQAMMVQDQQWSEYPLNIKRTGIHIVKSEEIFETAEIPIPETTQQAGGQK